MIRYRSIVGLAYRARKCSDGTDTILRDIQSNKARLLLIANDASDGTKKKLTDKCKSYHVPYIEVEDRKTLGQTIGKPERVAIAILDQGFADSLKSLLL